MKKLLKKLVYGFAPKSYHLLIQYFYLSLRGRLDAEMLYVSKLLMGNGRFIDVGANVGIYSCHYRNRFKKIAAFEPISEVTDKLSALQSDVIEMHNVALSDKNDELRFFIPSISGAIIPSLASLEKRNGDCIERIVKVRTLDSYDFDDVDFIKIDVEGHEKSVVTGAAETIKKCKPILLVEIEKRHINGSIDDVFEAILEFGYEGFFLQDGALVPINEFDYSVHQKPYLDNLNHKGYINNFIFMMTAR